MTDDVKKELIGNLIAARREMNRRLSEVNAAGLRVDLDTVESQSMADAFPRIQIDVKVYEKIV